MDQSSWVLANVPGVKELLKDFDRKTKESTPLGPYREQSRHLKHERVARFTGEAPIPTVDEVLARIDREETSLVSVETLAADLRRQQAEAQAVWSDFKSLGGQRNAPAAAAASSTLAIPASAFGEERARMLAASPLAQLLQAKAGLDLGSLLVQNRAEDCRVGFKEHRLTDGRSHVEKRMEELLQNRTAWREYRAIQDGSLSEPPSSAVDALRLRRAIQDAADDRGERFAPLERIAPMLKAPPYSVGGGETAGPRPQFGPAAPVAKVPGETADVRVGETVPEEAAEPAYQEARDAGFGKGLKAGFFNRPRTKQQERAAAGVPEQGDSDDALTVPSMADLLAQLDQEEDDEDTDVPDRDQELRDVGASDEVKVSSCPWTTLPDSEAVPSIDDLLAQLDQEDAEDG